MSTTTIPPLSEPKDSIAPTADSVLELSNYTTDWHHAGTGVMWFATSSLSATKLASTLLHLFHLYVVFTASNPSRWIAVFGYSCPWSWIDSSSKMEKLMHGLLIVNLRDDLLHLSSLISRREEPVYLQHSGQSNRQSSKDCLFSIWKPYVSKWWHARLPNHSTSPR